MDRKILGKPFIREKLIVIEKPNVWTYNLKLVNALELLGHTMIFPIYTEPAEKYNREDIARDDILFFPISDEMFYDHGRKYEGYKFVISSTRSGRLSVVGSNYGFGMMDISIIPYRIKFKSKGAQSVVILKTMGPISKPFEIDLKTDVQSMPNAIHASTIAVIQNFLHMFGCM
jgi:hypothetical protein